MPEPTMTCDCSLGRMPVSHTVELVEHHTLTIPMADALADDGAIIDHLREHALTWAAGQGHDGLPISVGARVRHPEVGRDEIAVVFEVVWGRTPDIEATAPVWRWSARAREWLAVLTPLRGKAR